MRQLHYCIESSLDGFIARPDHRYDFLPVAGGHQDRYLESMAEYDAAVMGRKTYDIGVEAGIMNPDAGLKMYVVSTSLRETISPAIEIIREDPIALIRQLKNGPGKNILLPGGARLAGSLLSAGLIDEIRVRIIPVLIGSGIPLFSNTERDVSLRLLAHEVYPNGVTLNVYRPVNS